MAQMHNLVKKSNQTENWYLHQFKFLTGIEHQRIENYDFKFRSWKF